MKSIRRVLVAGLVGVVTLCVAATPASAQMGRGGDMFNMPAVSGQQLEKYAGMLEMTPEQLEAAKMLHEAYQQQVREGQEAFRAKMEVVREEFRTTRDPEVWNQLREAGEKVQADRKKADETFFADIQMVLTPEQMKSWPAVERASRRDMTLRRGFLAGERVDLIRMFERADLTETDQAKVDEVLARYDTDMDRELQRRNQAYEDGFRRMAEMRENGDFASMQEIVEKGREAAARVRDLNRKYARELTSILSEDRKAWFEREFREASFPEVYRESYGGRVLTAAAGIDNLDASQRDGVAALIASYERDVSTVNDKLAATIEKQQMEFNIAQMMRGGRGGDNEMQTLRQQRRELDDKLVESLSKVLTPEQREKLPSREDEARERRGGGGDDGGRRGRGRGPA